MKYIYTTDGTKNKDNGVLLVDSKGWVINGAWQGHFRRNKTELFCEETGRQFKLCCEVPNHIQGDYNEVIAAVLNNNNQTEIPATPGKQQEIPGKEQEVPTKPTKADNCQSKFLPIPNLEFYAAEMLQQATTKTETRCVARILKKLCLKDQDYESAAQLRAIEHKGTLQ